MGQRGRMRKEGGGNQALQGGQVLSMRTMGSNSFQFAQPCQSGINHKFRAKPLEQCRFYVFEIALFGMNLLRRTQASSATPVSRQ
jgi:hypothetical protein